MATRLKGQHKNIDGVQYNIYIDDDTFSGSVTEFTLGAEGFTLNYEGQNTQINNAVLPSKVSFTMMVSNATHETFISDMVGADEKRFKVKITKGDTTETNFWFGIITPDISNLQDMSFPYRFQISATCGLGLLKGIEYNDAGTAYTGTDTFLEHIRKCLDKIGTFDFLTTEDAIGTAVNFYEDNHTISQSNDPLALSRVNHKAFFEIDSKGNKKYLSCYDVINNICSINFARILLVDGVYFVEQVPNRENASFDIRYYDKTGAATTDTNTSISTTINQTTVAKLTGVNYIWFPALRKTEINYDTRERRNLIAGSSWTDATGAEVDAGTVTYQALKTTLNITGLLKNTFTNTALTTSTLVYSINRIKVKVGSYYLKRNYSFNPSLAFTSPTWTTTASYYHYASSLSDIIGTIGAITNTTQAINILTPILLESGTLLFNFKHIDLRDTQGNLIDPADLGLTWELQNANIELLYDGTLAGQVQSRTYRTWNGSAYNDNSEVIEITTRIGDGTNPNSFGKIEVYNGTTWEDSDGWKMGNTGTATELPRLLGEEIIALQKTPIRKMQAAIKGTFTALDRLSDGSYNWVFMGGSFASERNTWRGEWFAISRDKTGQTSDPNEDSPTTGGTSGGGAIDPDVGTNTGGGGGIVTVNPDLQLPSQVVGDLFGITVIDSGITAGDTITSLPITAVGTDNSIVAGDTIKLVNPITNNTQNFTVSSNVGASDTQVLVNSTVASSDFPLGAFILQESSTAAAATSQGSEFQENATENDNSISYIAEVEDIIIETDANAGDGATAGLRFDTNGLKGYNSSNTESIIEILPDGTWKFATMDGIGGGGLRGGILLDETGVRLYKLLDTSPVVQLDQAGTWYLKTDPDVGNGSVKGVEISNTTIKNYNNSSTTPGIEMTDGILTINTPSHPTPSAGILYQYNNLFYFQANTTSKVFPLFAPSIRIHVYDNQTSWAVGIPGAFWRATGDFVGLEIYQIEWSIGSTTGLGLGTNTVEVKKQSTVLGTIDATSNYSGSITPTASTLAADDYFTFNVTNVRAPAPAQGLQVQLFFRKP